jgi:uncharacterized membrane protein
MAKSVIVLAAILIIIITIAAHAALTYPRTTASISVSFTIGADSKTVTFNQPLLDDKAQVKVSVQNGAALWRAQILSGNQVIWEHSASQGQQQSYSSGWIQLPSGNYNFTFGTIGLGSLDASATVTSKGGLW